jgi:hypothetical protein
MLERDGGAGAGGVGGGEAGAAGSDASGATGSAGTAGSTADASYEVAHWMPGDNGPDAGPDARSDVPPGQIQVTWTFKLCGDNAVTIGVVDQTTNKGLAGPVSAQKPRGNIFTLQPIAFTCAPGDIVCWSASSGEGTCGVCSDAMPVIGC